MNSNANRFRGLVELADILVKEDRLDDACQVLEDCQGGPPPIDHGAALFLMTLMKKAKNRKQCSKIAWLMDEFCPRPSSLSMKGLIRNRLAMHARCRDIEGWDGVLQSISRYEKLGVIRPSFRPLKVRPPKP